MHSVTDSNQLMVAVYMITYNHEPYIAQAIESVMMQQTSFSYKLFIGEDCSTDNTRQICIDYQQKYSDQIELSLNEKNLGPAINAQRMFELCFESKAKYIAILEGDDYWTDSNKLQKQVDFLQKNNGYAICFHHVMVIYADAKEKPHLFNGPRREINRDTFFFEDLISDLALMHTSSVVFRNVGIVFPDWYSDIKSGDIALFHLFGEHGLIGALQETMSVYRKNPQGITNAMTGHLNTQAYIFLYKSLNKHFKYKYNSKFKVLISQFYINDGLIHMLEKNKGKAIKAITQAFLYCPTLVLKNYSLIGKSITKMIFPYVYARVVSVLKDKISSSKD